MKDFLAAVGGFLKTMGIILADCHNPLGYVTAAGLFVGGTVATAYGLATGAAAAASGGSFSCCCPCLSISLPMGPWVCSLQRHCLPVLLC